MKFQLLGGTHTQWNPSFAALSDGEVAKRLTEQLKSEGFSDPQLLQTELKNYPSRGQQLVRLGAEQRFASGQIVESDKDLDRLHPNKFRRVDSGDEARNEIDGLRREVERLKLALAERQEAEQDNLDAKTVAELRAFAEDNEIDLGSAKTKPELIAAIRGAAVPA